MDKPAGSMHKEITRKREGTRAPQNLALTLRSVLREKENPNQRYGAKEWKEGGVTLLLEENQGPRPRR